MTASGPGVRTGRVSMKGQSMDLNNAFSQWANRPNDERFESLDSLLCYTLDRKNAARQAEVRFGDLHVDKAGGSFDQSAGLSIVGPEGRPAGLTNWSFGQLCSRVGAPAAYLETLTADRTIDLLNYGLQKSTPGDLDRRAKLLIDMRSGEPQIRALTSPKYGRLWDDTVVRECIAMRDESWRVPPARPCRSGQPGARPATQADLLDDQFGNLSITIGDMIAPAGIYCGDRDLFIFMVNEQIRIPDGTGQYLSRGFFAENSEVGKRKIRITAFLYDHVCGNHIVWGARNVIEISARHVGRAAIDAFAGVKVAIREYANQSGADDERKIHKAQETVIAASMPEVVKSIFAKLRGDVPRRVIEKGYLRAKSDARFDPATVYGLASGLTAESQGCVNADARAAMDSAAGRVMSIAL